MHHLLVEIGALWGSLWHFEHLQRVDLAESIYSKVIELSAYHHRLPQSLTSSR